MFRFHPEHLRTTYVRAEAGDWPTLRFHTTRPHRRKQSKHNKHYITNRLCFYHTRQGQNTSVFIQKQCPAHTALLQVETLLGHPQNIARVCGAPCPRAALGWPSGHVNSVHLRPPHLEKGESHAGTFDADPSLDGVQPRTGFD